MRLREITNNKSFYTKLTNRIIQDRSYIRFESYITPIAINDWQQRSILKTFVKDVKEVIPEKYHRLALHWYADAKVQQAEDFSRLAEALAVFEKNFGKIGKENRDIFSYANLYRLAFVAGWFNTVAVLRHPEINAQIRKFKSVESAPVAYCGDRNYMSSGVILEMAEDRITRKPNGARGQLRDTIFNYWMAKHHQAITQFRDM